MATWLRERLRDPSSSRPRPPEAPPPSDMHARLFGIMDQLAKMGGEGASELFPGGEAVAKLVLSKARGVANRWNEEQLNAYLDMAQRLVTAIRTGEGYEELRDP